MSLVYLAYHEMGCRGLRTLLAKGVSVGAVYTYDEDPDENCWFGSVAALAREADIPTFTSVNINAPETVEQIRALAPDILLSVYFRDMVGKPVRSIARHGSFNLHGSLLPKYRGRAPLNWQLVHGEKQAGVTLHHMVRRADAGDIVDQQAVDVGPDETAYELLQKLLSAGQQVLERQIDALLSGTAPRTVQDESKATLFAGRTPEDGNIDWALPAQTIHNLVRAVSDPWPGAFCNTGRGRVTVWQTRLLGDRSEAAGLAPGTIWITADGRPAVQTGDGSLELLRYDAPHLPDGERFAPGETLCGSPTFSLTSKGETRTAETTRGTAV